MNNKKTQRIAYSMMRNIFLAYQNNGAMQKFMEEAYVGQKETDFTTTVWEELANYMSHHAIVIPDEHADDFDEFVNNEISMAFKRNPNKPDTRKVMRSITLKIDHMKKGLPFKN